MYQYGQSESWVGDWMEQRGNRDDIVVATKYTGGFQHHDIPQSTTIGNGMKSLLTTVRNSLKLLKTDYIDILYVHWWSFDTSVEEVMRGLHSLVLQNKVLYLGISDTPAWIVVKANDYAKQHGLTPFSVYQGKWNVACRDMEREIIPMCQDQGMGIAPWGVLAQGDIKTTSERAAGKIEGGRISLHNSEREEKVSEVLEKMAEEKNTTLRVLAIAYVMQKAPYVFPILGGRKVDQLKANMAALSLELSEEDIKQINKVSNFDVGFPLNMLIGVDYDIDYDASTQTQTRRFILTDEPRKQQAFKPSQRRG